MAGRDDNESAPATKSAGQSDAGGGNGGTTVVKLAGLIVPAIVVLAVVWMQNQPERPGAGQPNVGQLTDLDSCLRAVNPESVTTEGAQSVGALGTQTKKEFKTSVSRKYPDPEVQKAILDMCDRYFSAAKENIGRVKLSAYGQPVKSGVKLSIGKIAKPMPPDADGLVVIDHVGSCAEGCLVNVDSSMYRLKDGEVRLTDAQLGEIVTLELARISDLQLDVSARDAQEVLIFSTKPAYALMKPDDSCEAHREECKEVEIPDSRLAAFRRANTTEELSYLSVKLRKAGEREWGDEIEVPIDADSLGRGLLKVPAPARAPSQAASCSNASAWLAQQAEDRFTSWESTRDLKLTASVEGGRVVDVSANLPLSAGEKRGLAAKLKPPANSCKRIGPVSVKAVR